MFMFNCVFTRVYTRCLIADVCTRLTLSEALTNPCSEKRDAWRLRMMTRKMTRGEKRKRKSRNKWITLIGMKTMQLTDVLAGNNQNEKRFLQVGNPVHERAIEQLWRMTFTSTLT